MNRLFPQLHAAKEQSICTSYDHVMLGCLARLNQGEQYSASYT
jgi:hypothetical protein